MTHPTPSRALKVGRLLLAGAVMLSLAGAELVLSAHWSDPAFAKSGNNAGGNGNGNGPGGNSGSAGGSNSGNGGSNAGGNSSGSNAGGNGKGKGASAASADGEDDTAVAPDAVLELRRAGKIKPLAELYEVVARQFGGEVVDAELVGDETTGWSYDVRVVTADGHLRDVVYGAASLAVLSIDGQPVE